MKNPTQTPITRESLLATASYNTRWFASLLAGTSVLGSAAFAVDNVWTGATTDWNTPTNWSQGRVPAFPNGIPSPNDFDDAIINSSTAPIATISASVSAQPRDIALGRGAGNTGRVDHTIGSLTARGWVMIGHDGGSGVYNLANTGVVVTPASNGPFAGFGQGTGSLQIDGQLRIGRGANGNGTVNVNTTGTLNVNSELRLGVDGNGAVGVLNVDSGAITMSSWLVLGNGGGQTGTLNMSGGSLTKNGGNHMILGDNGGTGTITQTAGTITVNGECWIGQNTGTGTINLSGGTLTNNNWVALGRSNNGSHGTVNHTGGTWNKTGGGNFIIGDVGQGVYNLSGTGALNVNGEFWVSSGTGSHGDLNMTGGSISTTAVAQIGRNAGVGTATVSGTSSINFAELWVGQGGSANGTLTFSSGTIVTNNWTVIGRDGGTGTVNMTGGTWNKLGGGVFIIGSSGPGTMNMSGGLVDVQSGYTWVGENGGATTATLNLSGTAEWRSPTMSVGQNTPNAILNMDGGTVRTQRFIGSREQNDTGTSGGTGTINFNGTQIVATANNTLNFISNTVDNAAIGNTGGSGSGGLLVNSNGFNLVAPKALSGPGGVVKSGAGTLTLSGASSYSGANTVTAGKLTLNGDSTGTGSITVADGAGLGVNQVNPANSLDPANVTFGTAGATTLDINVGNVAGNPTAAPLNVTGTLTVNGTVTINVADQFPAVGTIPLISYVGPKGGGGSFALGTLPNGVVATLQDNGTGLVYLDVTSAALPKWDGTNESGLTKTGDKTDGSTDIVVTDASGIVIGQPVRGPGVPSGTTVSAITGTTITLSNGVTGTATGVSFLFVTTAGTNEGVWDFVTENWFDQIINASSLYANPDPVLFDDSATGPTAVTLNTTVAPSSVTFNNSTKTYSLSGTGKITGSTGLTKAGTEALTLSTVNDYTGVTRLEGGTTTVGTLTNGGVASPIGAASSAASSLVFAGGTLNYTGGAVSIDRGISVAAANDTVSSGLTLASNLTISGPISATMGKLTKSGPGSLTLTNPGANVLAAGSGGETPQAFRFEEGALVLNTPGQTNTVTGYAAFGVTPSTASSLTLGNGAGLTVNGRTQLAFGATTTASMTISGTSTLQATDAVQIGLGADTTANVVIEDSGTLNKIGGWLSLGHSNSNATMTVRDSGTLSGNGDLNVGDVGNSTGTLNIEENATVAWTGGVFIGKNGTTGTLNLGGDANLTSGNTNVGGGANSDGNLNISGTSNYVSNGRLQVGPDAGGNGNVVIEGSGSMQVNSYVSVGFNGHGDMIIRGNGSFTNTDDFSVNESGDAPVTVTLEDSGALSMARVLYIGRNAGRVGVLNVTESSTVNQTDAAYSVVVGPAGTGTLNISGTSAVTAAGNAGLVITNNATGTGIVNLDGGTLTVKKISDAGGNSTFHFNGGVLKANAGADLNFLSGLNTLDVKAGGAFIDSNGQTIAINQAIADANGGLTKLGAGTLQLNEANGYFLATTVTAGALGGDGSVAGELVVQTNGTIAPGISGVGTFTVEDLLATGSSIAGSYVCEISGATSDSLTVGGPLTIQPGAILNFDVLAAPTAPVYVIASYSTLSGTFTVQDLPAGYTLDYGYAGGTQIALVQTATPYSTWATSYGLDPLTDGAPGFDKDGDGQNNSVEFALGGSPISGSDNAKIYSLGADSDADGDATKELILTIAVRSGTPAFSNDPAPTATQDGYTYTVQGSTTLTSFAVAATPTTTPVTTNLPAAPAGYEYRSFSLAGSNGFPSKGFLKVLVTP